jgi:hypothetical protein
VNDKYKLADPGFAKFKKTLEEKDGKSFPKIIADGGTTTYGTSITTLLTQIANADCASCS